jgi:hypothetical protein
VHVVTATRLFAFKQAESHRIGWGTNIGIASASERSEMI